MSEHPAVAAANNNSKKNLSAYEAALQRAKQVAAKLNPTFSDTQKRKLEDPTSPGEPDSKKSAYYNSSPESQQSGMQGLGGMASMPGMGQGQVTKDIRIPDKMVGLIIGRGGEQVSRLQSESGCKIQMTPNPHNNPERLCTLTGTPDCIQRAEDMIWSIVSTRKEGSNSYMDVPGMNQFSKPSVPTMMNSMSSNFTQVDMIIPGNKVGLVIGKGGETIKQLQEKAGVKMVIIQDSSSPASDCDKPLRITGDPQKVEHAKVIVQEFLAEKDMQMKGRNSGMNYNNGSMRGGDKIECSLSVPSNKCGVIIGKGGETIKQINAQTGAHCEIDRKNPPRGDEKVFLVRGTPEQVDQVKRIFADRLNMPFGGGSSGGSYNGPSDYGMGGMGPCPPGSQAYNNGGGWGGAPFAPTQWQGGGPSMPSSMPVQQMGSNGPGGAVQDYSAQWIEYYKNMGMMKEAAAVEEQAKAGKMMSGNQIHTQMGSSGAQVDSHQQGGGGVGGGASASGGADYSAQWAQYYRSVGRVKDAEVIENQIKAKMAAAGGNASAPSPAMGSGSGGGGGSGTASAPVGGGGGGGGGLYNHQNPYGMMGGVGSVSASGYYGGAGAAGGPSYHGGGSGGGTGGYPAASNFPQQQANNDLHQ